MRYCCKKYKRLGFLSCLAMRKDLFGLRCPRAITDCAAFHICYTKPSIGIEATYASSRAIKTQFKTLC